MGRRPKLSDIAEAVGVSVSSVSLALRGAARISPETAARIHAEARRIGYVQNKTAAGLRTQRSDVVAVCLNELSNPVFNEFLTHIENAFRQAGRIPVLGVVREDLDQQQAFLHTAIAQGVGGLLLCPARGTTATDLAAILPSESGHIPFPTVLFSRTLDDVDVPQFANDDAAAGRMMAARLLEAGHRQIQWIGGGHASSTARERQSGLAMELARRGAPPPVLRHGETSRQFGFEAAVAVLDSGTRDLAFACFSDLTAIGVLAALAQRGIMAGRDASVIGCDDMEEARFCHPPLTSVRIDKAWIGRGAALQVMSEAPCPPEIRRVAPQLVDRQTVRSAHGNDAES